MGTYFALFFIFWWICLFMVLPFAGKSQAEEGDVTLGTVKSAPHKLRIWWIIGINSLVSALFSIGFFVAIEVLGLGLEDISFLFPTI